LHVSELETTDEFPTHSDALSKLKIGHFVKVECLEVDELRGLIKLSQKSAYENERISEKNLEERNECFFGDQGDEMRDGETFLSDVLENDVSEKTIG